MKNSPAVAFIALVLLCFALPALADTIYLKNGRVIHSGDAVVDGNQVIFRQFGGYQSLPMDLVERIERNDRNAPGEFRSPPAAAPAVLQSSEAAAAPAPRPNAPAQSAEALRALSTLIPNTSGGIDVAQALQVLQGLGGQGGGTEIESLAPLLGLAGAGGQGSGLGDMAGDLAAITTVLPALSKLGAALFAGEYSAAATEAATRDLISSLESLGVSQAEIRARAQQLGVPADILDKIRSP